ncbi:transcription factor with AP2 domain(s), partial [Reticulomyxa filosa]
RKLSDSLFLQRSKYNKYNDASKAKKRHQSQSHPSEYDNDNDNGNINININSNSNINSNINSNSHSNSNDKHKHTNKHKHLHNPKRREKGQGRDHNDEDDDEEEKLDKTIGVKRTQSEQAKKNRSSVELELDNDFDSTVDNPLLAVGRKYAKTETDDENDDMVEEKSNTAHSAAWGKIILHRGSSFKSDTPPSTLFLTAASNPVASLQNIASATATAAGGIPDMD